MFAGRLKLLAGKGPGVALGHHQGGNFEMRGFVALLVSVPVLLVRVSWTCGQRGARQ